MKTEGTAYTYKKESLQLIPGVFGHEESFATNLKKKWKLCWWRILHSEAWGASFLSKWIAETAVIYFKIFSGDSWKGTKFP